MNNWGLSQTVLNALQEIGVEEVVLCSGARNAPIVRELSYNKNFKIYNFFDERAASFWALGRIQKTNRPVVVVTTSGTAVSECLSAIIEAYYSQIPLILISADRPHSFRNTGAPQSIDQVSFLKYYVQWQIDIDLSKNEKLNWNWELPYSPVHINLCFDEPLWEEEAITNETIQWYEGPEFDLDLQQFYDFMNEVERPLVIVSKLDYSSITAVESFLVNNQLHCYLEGPSGLRESENLKDLCFKCHEKQISKKISNGDYDSILRIGGVPTTRVWRDLESKLKNIKVYSLSNTPFPGITRGDWQLFPLPILAEIDLEKIYYNKGATLNHREKEIAIFNEYPSAELSLVHHLSKKLDKSEVLFIGNSLAIREWDIAATEEHCFKVECNRGVNGIDGLISSFLAMCSEEGQNSCILGDLSLMYDMNAFWALRYTQAENINIFVINNSGGKIFERIFSEKLFYSEHSEHFEYLAKMWSMDYYQWQQIPDSIPTQGFNLIEIIPNLDDSSNVWKCLEEIE